MLNEQNRFSGHRDTPGVYDPYSLVTYLLIPFRNTSFNCCPYKTSWPPLHPHLFRQIKHS